MTGVEFGLTFARLLLLYPAVIVGSLIHDKYKERERRGSCSKPSKPKSSLSFKEMRQKKREIDQESKSMGRLVEVIQEKFLEIGSDVWCEEYGFGTVVEIGNAKRDDGTLWQNIYLHTAIQEYVKIQFKDKTQIVNISDVSKIVSGKMVTLEQFVENKKERVSKIENETGISASQVSIILNIKHCWNQTDNSVIWY